MLDIFQYLTDNRKVLEKRLIKVQSTLVIRSTSSWSFENPVAVIVELEYYNYSTFKRIQFFANYPPKF